ncbi:MAG: flagella basal body P-ring formation protein FlgA [Rhodospirillales bacterium 70-18]|nr:flagellar basal body P-ring formation protein FlgA [Rhodospirillales bacterium]OJY76871.1 MAG: flagella basal body P-ring formation protein FlgA [Rhodospirillales bacterium 70-18]
MKSPFLAALGLLAALMHAPNPAWGATLRPITTLSAGVVRLSDLFDDAGPEAQRVLGPAPAPGARIVVESRQLAAIARQFRVDWRPASTGDRIVLDRPGRLLDRAEAVAALRDALAGVGAPADAEIELPGFSAPLIPQDAKPQFAVEQLDYQGGAGRFTAQLAVTADDMAPLRLRLSGTLAEMVTLPVPAHRLAPGSVIAADDLIIARVRAGLVRGAVAQAPAQAVGLAPRRMLMPGQPLLLADLRKPEAVAKGARVAMQLLAPGLLLLAQGQALESGAVGERIQVLNPASRAVVEAEIVGRDRVRVAPGSVPLATPGTAGFYSNYAAQVAVR